MVRYQRGPSPSKAPMRPLAKGTSLSLFDELEFPASPCGSRSRRSSRTPTKTPTKLQLASPTKSQPLPGQPLEPSASEVEQEAVNVEGEGAALASSATLSPASPCKQERGAAVVVQEVSQSSSHLHHQKTDHSGQAWSLQRQCIDSGTPMGKMEALHEACLPLTRASSLQSDGTWCVDSLASAEPVKQVKVPQLQIAKLGSVGHPERQRSKDALRLPTSSESQHSKGVPAPHVCAWKAYQSRVQHIASRSATHPPVEVADAPLAHDKLAIPSSASRALLLATARLAVESADYPVLLGQGQELQATGAASIFVTDRHGSSPGQAETSRCREAQEAPVSTRSDVPARNTKKLWHASLRFWAEKRRSLHPCTSVSARA